MIEFFDLQTNASSWNLTLKTSCIWWWLFWHECCAPLNQKYIRMVNQEEFICTIKNKVDVLWQQLSFTWENLMTWLRTNNGSLKRKLLSSWAFFRKWIVLLFFNVIKLKKICSSHVIGRKLQGFNYGTNCCPVMRRKVRNFFTAS